MATSPNYGWLEPDNTDLVKNGALAIRTLGNAIDTTMATMTPKSIVDAKGDLIAASAADTPARLAVGNNGETLVADSSTSTGLRYQSGYNGNAIINGGLDIWQRGTSFSSFVAVYTADRWLCNRQSAVTGLTISRQSSGLTGIQYSMRAQRDSGNTGLQDIYLQNSLESMDSYRFAGQTVTVSFYAKAGANFSGASSNSFAYLYSGTGTDQNLFSGYTGNAVVASSTAITLTTSWQRFSITGTVATNATELGVRFGWTPTGTASTNDWLEITGVQLELGSVATNFKRAGGTIQGELAACQRYYWRAVSGSAYNTYASGYNASTTISNFNLMNPVAMRTGATSIDYSTVGVHNGNGTAVISATNVALSYSGVYSNWITVTVASGLTAGYGTLFGTQNSTTAYVGLSAEL